MIRKIRKQNTIIFDVIDLDNVDWIRMDEQQHTEQ